MLSKGLKELVKRISGGKELQVEGTATVTGPAEGSCRYVWGEMKGKQWDGSRMSEGKILSDKAREVKDAKLLGLCGSL